MYLYVFFFKKYEISEWSKRPCATTICVTYNDATHDGLKKLYDLFKINQFIETSTAH